MRLNRFKIKYLKASSLIEALIALVILIVISVFILLIMNNVNNKSNVGLKTRALNEANNIFNRSLMDEDYSDRNFDYKNFYITCQTNSCTETDKLVAFKVSAFNSDGKLILCKQRLVNVENDQTVEKNNGVEE
jgi:Tfp pilus assembly protein PilV